MKISLYWEKNNKNAKGLQVYSHVYSTWLLNGWFGWFFEKKKPSIGRKKTSQKPAKPAKPSKAKKKTSQFLEKIYIYPEKRSIWRVF